MAGLTGAVRAVVAGGRRPAARSSVRSGPVVGSAVVVRDERLPVPVPAGTTVLSVSEPAPAAQRDLASEAIGWQLRGAGPVRSSVNVTQETALRSSAWWAGLRLRANLEAALPLDVYMRASDGSAVEMTKPDLLEQPMPDSLDGAHGMDIAEHMGASRFDLQRYGNSVGIIRAWSAYATPLAIELAPMSEVSAIVCGTQVRRWRICGEEYPPSAIWHERENIVGGWPIGLNALAYSAWMMSGYLSAQEFVSDWFFNGAAPAGVLKNTIDEDLSPAAIEKAKAQFKLAVAGRDVFVSGAEWEWTPAAMDAQSAGFLEQQQASAIDTARYLDIPGDMIDAPSSGSSITYGNITQRNLQLLIMNVGPGLRRRERYWSRYGLPARRYMRFNTRAFLRLDPQTQTQLLLSEVGAGMITPTEYRALQERQPYTAEQLDELRQFGIIGGQPAAVPAGGAGAA